jgi:hypothetical protein
MMFRDFNLSKNNGYFILGSYEPIAIISRDFSFKLEKLEEMMSRAMPFGSNDPYGVLNEFGSDTYVDTIIMQAENNGMIGYDLAPIPKEFPSELSALIPLLTSLHNSIGDHIELTHGVVGYSHGFPNGQISYGTRTGYIESTVEYRLDLFVNNYRTGLRITDYIDMLELGQISSGLKIEPRDANLYHLLDRIKIEENNN